MKKFVPRMGGLLLVLYLGWVMGIGYYSTHRTIWTAESRHFLDRALVPILNDPSVFAFHALADHAERQGLNRDGRALVHELTELGPLRAFQVRGGAELVWSHGPTISARYHLRAHFQRGAALFRIALVKRHGSWLISTLQITRTASSP